MGYIITPDGIQVDESKVMAIKSWQFQRVYMMWEASMGWIYFTEDS